MVKKKQSPVKQHNLDSLPGVYPALKKDGTPYYRASFTYHGKHISLGSFSTKEEANGAYLEALKIMKQSDLTVTSFQLRKFLPFEKWVLLCNFRDHGFYFSTPIYIRNNYFSYYLDELTELKFSIDDLFYYSSHKIMRRKGHFFVSDYGMQVTILNRYGIKNYGVKDKDYKLLNGDPYDFRYENIEILNHYHGVQKKTYQGKEKYQARIHIHGDYIIGYFNFDYEAAIAYNKSVDLLKDHGCPKKFQLNYIDTLKASQYAEIYHSISIPEKITALRFKENACSH